MAQQQCKLPETRFLSTDITGNLSKDHVVSPMNEYISLKEKEKNSDRKDDFLRAANTSRTVIDALRLDNTRKQTKCKLKVNKKAQIITINK